MVRPLLGTLIFAIVGLFGDIVTTVSGEYDYFNINLLPFIDPMQIIHKFLALSPMAIAYALLNGFYEEFFFLGVMTSVNDKYKWWALAYSILNSDFLPYLPRFALGSGHWSYLWTLLLCSLQEGDQKPFAILPHACFGRYVWL